jgi:hypothetical protein
MIFDLIDPSIACSLSSAQTVIIRSQLFDLAILGALVAGAGPATAPFPYVALGTLFGTVTTIAVALAEFPVTGPLLRVSAGAAAVAAGVGLLVVVYSFERGDRWVAGAPPYLGFFDDCSSDQNSLSHDVPQT